MRKGSRATGQGTAPDQGLHLTGVARLALRGIVVVQRPQQVMAVIFLAVSAVLMLSSSVNAFLDHQRGEDKAP